ncbi:MAG: GIY-YIG nuclease family protein [Candidatus Marinimicrobia bacterium]|jgi:putative endonuclease|nr:GIY-YIG nuclease family protein [Candidatus Neomarinimicrobiota bacterium]
MWYVYVIKSSEGLIYTGMTQNLQSRLIKHNACEVLSTKKGSNWKIIYSEELSSSSQARKREKYFKNNAGKEWLKRRKIL